MKILELNIEYFAYDKDHFEIKSLSGQSISVNKGERIAVIGASGCGKSSLLKIISGLEKNFSGFIKKDAKTSFVLQEYGLFPWKKLGQNIALPLKLEKKDKKYIDKKVSFISKTLGIEEILDKFPDNVSGGQKQRVAIARALITDPDLLLLDEPFNSLDSLTREDIQDMVLNIASKRKMAFIIVTHNIEECVYMADRVLIMDADGDNEFMDIERDGISNKDFRNTALYYEQVNILRNKLRSKMGGNNSEK